MKYLNLALILSAIAGCGGSTAKKTNPDLAVGADMAAAGNNDMTQQSNADMTIVIMSTCGAPNAACTAGAENGLCKSGNCSPCTDTTDDALCATAYPGTICTGGNCIAGCHTSATCAGKICDADSHVCRSCSQDADCPVATPFCNTSTGVCGVSAPACTNSMACNNGTGFCCNSVCITGGQCCGNADCTVGGQTCNTTTNACVNTTNCTDGLTANKLYVNPSPTPGFSGVGSKQCPFVELTSAFHNAPSPAPAGYTICTQGNFNSTSDAVWPRYIPTNIEMDGTYCGMFTTHTIFTVPSAQPGVEFTKAGPATIHGYDIISAFGNNPNKTNSGIYVSNTGTSPTAPGANPIKIYDITVHNFARGIYASTGTGDNAGNVAIGDGVHSGNNADGLKIDNGAKVVITTTDATQYDGFQDCDSYGIHVVDGSLTIQGQTASSSATETTVRCGNATDSGVYISDGRAKVNIDHLHSSGNMRQGLATINTASVTVTNSTFNSNTLHGIHIFQDASALKNQSVATLNFGTADTGSGAAGFNTISGNTATGINMDLANSDALQASGNNFGTHKNCVKGQDQTVDVTVNNTACDSKPYDLCGPTGGVAKGVFAIVNDCTKCECNTSGAGACAAGLCPP